MMPRIAIVGAGIAGLTAAHTLQRAGLACDLYEAANRVGGRMHSDSTTWADGMVSEWCGEFIDSAHTTMRQLIAHFGLSLVALDHGTSGQAPSLMYFLGHFYEPDELGRDFQALAPLMQQQIQEAGFPTTYAHFTEAGWKLDHLSAHEWIERHVPGGRASPLGRFLTAACTGLYGLDTEEQSALNLIYLFGAHDASGNASAPRPLQGSSKIAGGNEQLPLAIARSLPDGSIHLEHELVALERMADDSLSLTFATTGGSAQVTQVNCDYAILTLPFSALRRVDYRRAGFDALKQTTIEQLGYGTISKLCMQFNRPFWYDDGPWPRAHNGFLITDLDIQTVWDASIGQTGAQGLLMDYTSGRRGAAYTPPTAYATTDDSASIQRYVQNCLEQLECVFPGARDHYTGRAALSYPTGDPYLLGSYACWRVGQYTQFAGYEGARQGPVLFAGEHCSVEFQGYMEGAAREGERAAREIVQEVGQELAQQAP
jgi:monoamine oxidase